MFKLLFAHIAQVELIGARITDRRISPPALLVALLPMGFSVI